MAIEQAPASIVIEIWQSILGGFIIILVNLLVSLLLIKARVKQEVSKAWQKWHMLSEEKTLAPVINKVAALVANLEEANWGELSVINAIDECVLTMRPHQPTTFELVKTLEGLKCLISRKLPPRKRLFSRFITYRMNRRRSAYIAEVMSLISHYRKCVS